MNRHRQRATRALLWAAVLAGLLASLWSAGRRWQAEARNRGVEIVLDYNELRQIAAAQGFAVGDVLLRFRQSGATAVTLDEDTVGGLEGARRVQVLPVTDPQQTTLRFGPDTYGRALAALRNKTRWQVAEVPAPPGEPPAAPGGGYLSVGQSFAAMRAIGVGVDPQTARAARRVGLRIVGRVSNYAGIRSEGLAFTLDQLQGVGASTVLFLGDEVLGNKGLIKPDPSDPRETAPLATTQSAMTAEDLHYATVEFGKQKGDAELVRALPERVVRLHTVTGAEMNSATVPGNVQRFLLAARERNIRMLLVRLFLSEPDALNKNAAYVKQIHDRLGRGRLNPGPAHGYPALSTPLGVRLLIALGIAAGWLLLADGVTGLFAPGAGVGPLTRFAAVGGAVLLLLLPLAGTTGAKFAALAAGCLFPSLALLDRDALRPERSGVGPLAVALLRFSRACAITAVGAAAVVGLLADRLFLLKADAFVGVKATLVVPLALVALVYALDLRTVRGDDGRIVRSWGRTLTDVRDRLLALAARPVMIWQVAVGAVALAALAVLVMRSGNDPGVGVSGFELRLRSLLDAYLPARPRFKDIFAHPALLIGFALAARGRRTAAIPLVIVGAIGQASLLNTFCHLHTPLPASLARALLGAGFGVIIGLLLWFVLDRIVLSRFGPAPARTDAAVPAPEPADAPA